MSYSHVYKKKSSPWRQRGAYLGSLDAKFLAKAIAVITYALVLFAGAYCLLRRSNILPPNAVQKFAWRAFIYAIPSSLVLALESREHPVMDEPSKGHESYASSRTFGAKSEAVKKILGLDSGSFIARFRRADTTVNLSDTGLKTKMIALPGLFNRDNECYQNSVIQGLASLGSFSNFVRQLPASTADGAYSSLTGALQSVVEQLNDAGNNGRSLWTPWALKSMSSWQQQDAQEYYSRVIDEVEKDASRFSHPKMSRNASLSLIIAERDPKERTRPDSQLRDQAKTMSGVEQLPMETHSSFKNPLEGLQAQRVGCLKCGFVEGLSLIPFNCLTVSLGRNSFYDIETLLDMYADLESIPGVECAQCTLLRQEFMFEQMLKPKQNGIASPREEDKCKTEFLASVKSRLEAVQAALRERDYSEPTLAKKCCIPTKSRVTTDKTKQSVIARPPQSLTLHVNRSVFDEYTGTQLKNYARVRFPKVLDLSPWCLGSDAWSEEDGTEQWELDPSKSMITGSTSADSSVSENSDRSTLHGRGIFYTLRAVITHYGTHGDGHYIAYRQSPDSITSEGDGSTTNIWWRLSDDDVFQVDEEVVLAQSGVFMLFYEQLEGSGIRTPESEDEDDSNAQNLPSSLHSEAVLSSLESSFAHLSGESGSTTALDCSDPQSEEEVSADTLLATEDSSEQAQLIPSGLNAQATSLEGVTIPFEAAVAPGNDQVTPSTSRISEGIPLNKDAASVFPKTIDGDDSLPLPQSNQTIPDGKTSMISSFGELETTATICSDQGPSSGAEGHSEEIVSATKEASTPSNPRPTRSESPVSTPIMRTATEAREPGISTEHGSIRGIVEAV